MNAPLLPPALARLGERELLVTETFLSIQGESTHAGQPCFFIRLTGCPLRCVWCDTEYAFHEGRPRSVDACLEEARAQGTRLVEVTGGEPLSQRAVHPLLEELCDAGHTVLLETSGALPIDRVDSRVRRIVDWKAPGSGEAHRNRDDVLAAIRPGDELKVVLLDRADYVWARERVREWRRRRPDIGTAIPVHLSPVFGRCSYAELAGWILEDGLPVRLGLQLHKHIWSPGARGV